MQTATRLSSSNTAFEEAASRTRSGRIAGALYLITIVAGIFSLIYVPAHLYVHDDIAATARNIVAEQTLYRWGIIVGAAGYVAFTLLPLSLFQLFETTNRAWAVTMMVLALIAMPMDFLAIANQLDVISLLTADKYQHLYSTNELLGNVARTLDAASDKIIVSEIFWGLWLFPFGLLVFHCNFLPKVLGVALMLGCLGYLIVVAGEVFSIDFSLGGWISLPATVGEIGTGLWLLIAGPRRWLWQRPSMGERTS
ncbi:MAG: DUF4386 domain-containing protein [Rudaea sp.]